MHLYVLSSCQVVVSDPAKHANTVSARVSAGEFSFLLAGSGCPLNRINQKRITIYLAAYVTIGADSDAVLVPSTGYPVSLLNWEKW